MITPIAKIKNSPFAIPALPVAILVNPKKPATIDNKKNMTAHFKNIFILFLNIFFDHCDYESKENLLKD